MKLSPRLQSCMARPVLHKKWYVKLWKVCGYTTLFGDNHRFVFVISLVAFIFWSRPKDLGLSLDPLLLWKGSGHKTICVFEEYPDYPANECGKLFHWPASCGTCAENLDAHKTSLCLPAHMYSHAAHMLLTCCSHAAHICNLHVCSTKSRIYAACILQL